MQRTRICRLLTLAILVGAVVLIASSQPALAQDNIYALGYYSNANNGGVPESIVIGAPDATLRLANDGNVSDASPAGDLCASIYVFDNREQLKECCSCRITPNGLLTLSVNKNLTFNNLTPGILTLGVIKVISSVPSAGVCNPAVVSTHVGIRGWLTHIQDSFPNVPRFNFTEEELTDSTLGTAEGADLAEDCGVAIELGSGFGVCGPHISGTDFCFDAAR